MLLKDDCEVVLAASVDEALRALSTAPPDLVLLDLVMPGRSGFDLLSELAAAPDTPPVVVLTGTKTVATAVEAMKRGAADYVTKPFEVEALRIKIRQLLERRDLEREVVRLRAQVEKAERLGDLLGGSEAMQEVFHTIRRVTDSRVTVLIRGESGTGKELADHDYIGILAEQILQRRGEAQTELGVHLDLIDTLQLVLDRILHGHDIAVGQIQLGQYRVERG